MSKTKIHWRCPICDYKNRWKWAETDVMAGEMWLECDSCHCLSEMFSCYNKEESRWRFSFLGSFFTKNRERRFIVG